MNSIPRTRASIKRLRNEGDEDDRKNEKRVKFANTPRTLRPRTLKTPATAKPKTATTTRTPRPRTLRLRTQATAKPKTPATAKPKTPATAKPKTPATAKPKTPATAKPKTPKIRNNMSNTSTKTKSSTKTVTYERYKNLNLENDELHQGLYHLYGTTASKNQVNTMFKKLDEGSKMDIVQAQIEHLQKRQVPKLNSSKSFDVPVKASDRDFDVDFMFLVWLDTRHDKTTTGSFSKFLKSDFVKELYNNRTVSFRKTMMIERILDLYKTQSAKAKAPYKFFVVDNNDINLTDTSGWESFLKRNLGYIFGLKDQGYDVHTTKFGPDIFLDSANDGKVKLLVGLDQEDNNRKTISDILLRTTVRHKTTNKKVKLIQPYFSVAQMLDPGSGMPMVGIKGDITTIMSSNPHSRLAWDFAQLKFNMSGKMTVEVYFDTRIREYRLKLNNNTIIKPSASASTAKTGDVNAKLSKFFGDFLQVLYMSRLSGRGQSVAIGTGDGVMTAIYSFIMKRCFNVDPILILDLSKDSKIRLIGVNDILNRTKLIKVSENNNRSTVANMSNFNMKNNVPKTSKGLLNAKSVSKIPNNKSALMNRFFKRG